MVGTTGTTNDPYLDTLGNWQFVGVSPVVEATTTAITLSEPAGVADGDLLVACFASRTSATTPITNTGWLPAASQNNSNTATNTSATPSGTMLYQVRNGTPDLSFVVPAGISVVLGRIAAYRGNLQTAFGPLVPSANVISQTNVLDWPTTRNETPATIAPPNGTTATIGISTFTGQFQYRQLFLTINTSTIPTDATTAELVLNITSATASATDALEVREVPSASNGIAGDSLGSYPLLGSKAIPAGTGRFVITLSLTSMTRGSAIVLCIHSQKQRTAATPNGTSSEAVAVSSLTGTYPPQLQVTSAVLSTTTAGTTATNVTTVTVAGLTTTQDDDLLVAMGAGGQEATWSSFGAGIPGNPSGATDTTSAPKTDAWTERADSFTATGADTSLAIFDAVMATAGATNNLAATASLAAAHVIVAAAFKIGQPILDAWNAADKSSSVTLSNQQKTAAHVVATIAGVRSTQTYVNGTAGKYYAEFLFTSGAPHWVGIAPTSNVLSDTTLTFAVLPTSGDIYVASTLVGNVGAGLTTNDILCVAWDAGAERVWFRKNGGLWNNDASADPATGTNGKDCSFAASTAHALWARWPTSTGGTTTVRTEAAEFTQTTPSGFLSWMGESLGSDPNVTVTPTGVSAAAAVGTAAATGIQNVSVAATGVSAGTALGTATAAVGGAVTVAASGVSALSSLGTATATGIVSGGGALWTPADLTTNQIGWYDGADSSKLIFGGSNLTQWTDKSPATSNVTPFGTGPTLVSVNSLGSLQFNGQGLRTSTAISLGDFIVFVVFTPNASGAYERLVDHDFPNGFWIGRDSTNAAWGGGIRLGVAPYGYFVPLANSATHIVSSGRSGTTQTVKGNGGAVSTSQACDGAATLNNIIGIGGGYNDVASDRLDGDYISEVLIYSATLPVADEAKVEGYLAWKWGIQASLPAGHPYKSAAPTTGAGGGVTVAATGVSATAALGTATATGKINVSTSATGQTATAALGTATAAGATNISTSASGQAATAALGTATAAAKINVSVAATGVTAATALGGASASAGGSITAAPAGVEAVTALGTATAEGKINVSVSATGVSAAALVGTATASGIIGAVNGFAVAANANYAVYSSLFDGATSSIETAPPGNPVGYDNWYGEDAAGGVSVTVTPAGVSAAAQLGTASAAGIVNVTVPADGVAAGSAVGTVSVVSGISVTAPTVGVTAGSAVGTVNVATTQSVTIAAAGVSAATALGGASVAVGGGISVQAGSFALVASAGTATVTAKQAVTVAAAGVSAATALGTAAVRIDSTTVAAGAACAAVTGTATVTAKQSVIVAATGVTATAAIGGVSVAVGGGISVQAAGFALSAPLGIATVTAKQFVTTIPAGVAAAALAGTSSVSVRTSVAPSGVTAASALGAVTVTAKQSVIVAATGVSAATALGGVSASAGGSISVVGSGVEAVARAGTATATGKQSVIVAASGVAAAAALGTVTASGKINISTMPAGTVATTALGSVTVTARINVVALPAGVAATAAAGTATATGKRNVSTMPVGVAAFAVTGTATAIGFMGGVAVWTGSAFEQKPVKVWMGAAWVAKPPKTWNGNAWV